MASWKRVIWRVVVPLGVLYLLLGALVVLRALWWTPPQHASDAFIRALRERDAAGIYLFSELLGPHLDAMLAEGHLSDAERRELRAKDFARFSLEFERGGKSLDSMRRERLLLGPPAEVRPEEPESYKAEVATGQTLDLVDYHDVRGEVYNRYYRVTYPTQAKSQPLGLFDNVRSEPHRPIRSALVRLEVRPRPDLSGFRKQILGWHWLDSVRWAFPFAGPVPEPACAEVWMVGVSFDVDKLTLETF